MVSTRAGSAEPYEAEITQSVPQRAALERAHVEQSIVADRLGRHLQSTGIAGQVRHEHPPGHDGVGGRPALLGTLAIYPQIGISVTSDRLENGPRVGPVADAGGRAALVDPLDHLGIEPAADHQQEQAAVRPAGVEPSEPPIADRVGQMGRIVVDSQVAGQQVGRAQRKHGDRRPRLRAVGNFGHRAVAASGHDRAQLSGRLIAVRRGLETAEIVDHLRRKMQRFETCDKLGDRVLARPAAGGGIGHHEYTIGRFAVHRCTPSIARGGSVWSAWLTGTRTLPACGIRANASQAQEPN